MTYTGFHEPSSLPIKAGDMVRIKKGTTLRSTHPRKDQPYEAGRTYTVTVDHVLPGISTCEPDGSVTPKSNPSVRWAGSGGYWVEVDMNDLDPV